MSLASQISVSASGLLLLGFLSGCAGDDASSTGDTETTGSSESATGTDSEAGTDTVAETDTGTDTDAETDTGTDTDEPISPYDGELLPDAEVDEWNWVGFPDTLCRNGSTAGIGVRYGLENKVMIYFQGGGACFNSTSCGFNLASYGSGDFDSWKDGGGRQGVLDSENPDNPLAEWSVIYVPYCTGDVHAGDNPDAELPGVGTQQFVGYRNVDRFLNRVVPTFFDAEHVLVSGVSAGGFGAALNFDRIAEAFPKSEATLLDDSGPPMADDYLAPCLQSQWRDAWNLDMTLPQDCEDCFPDDGGGLINLAPFIGAKHSDSVLALISSDEDSVIRSFFGFGSNECNVLLPSMPASLFKEGLYDLRDNALKSGGMWGSFIIPADKHTWIDDNGVYSTEVSGMLMIDWITDILVRDPQHISPE